MDDNSKTLTGLCNELIKQAENGHTITANALKSLAQTTLNVIDKFKEQNRDEIAFHIMARKMLTPETFNKVEEAAKMLVRLEKEDRLKNG